MEETPPRRRVRRRGGGVTAKTGEKGGSKNGRNFKPTNCKKVTTNSKNVATNANKHLQTKPTNTQKVTTNANKCQQTPKTKPTNTIINLLQTYYKFVVGL